MVFQRMVAAMSCADADCKYPKCDCWSIKERNDPRYLKSLLRGWMEWYEANAYGVPGASALVEETAITLEELE